MWFQRFLKGIGGLTDNDATEILRRRGLICRWWQEAGTITPEEIAQRLTPANLLKHLDDYASIANETPFISLTAGVRLREAGARGFGGRNRTVRARETALQYATNNFKSRGHIFYGYVMVLPKPSVELQEFAEDVRDINMYGRYRRFHRQGEVTAKIEVPSVRLERVETWDPASGGSLVGTVTNPDFQPPEDHANIRHFL